MRKRDCVFEGLYLDGCHDCEELNGKKRKEKINIYKYLLWKEKKKKQPLLRIICNYETEQRAQFKVWTYNIYQTFFFCFGLDVESMGYSRRGGECECDINS